MNDEEMRFEVLKLVTFALGDQFDPTVALEIAEEYFAFLVTPRASKIAVVSNLREIK